MPRVACWLLRGALLNLLLGVTVGAAMLWDLGLPYASWPWRLLALHQSALLIGWLAQATMGIASWVLPRTRTSPESTRFAWMAFALLNLGVASAALGGWLTNRTVGGLGATFEALSAAAFSLYVWQRVRSVIPGR